MLRVDALGADPGAAPVRSALDCAAARGGYAWWYVEVHDTVEQRFGLTLIMFVGAVFSPDYAQRLRQGESVCGLDYPAVNLALYERPRGGSAAQRHCRQRLWVMNEYPAAQLATADRRLVVNRSSIEYGSDGSIRVSLDEECTRFFGRPGPPLRAKIAIAPALAQASPPPTPISLGENRAGECHFWQPMVTAGQATVELDCGSLEVRYRGVAYSDRNFGSGRLEDTFARWSWAHGVDGQSDPADPATLVLYRAEQLDGQLTRLAVQRAAAGAVPTITRLTATAADPPPLEVVESARTAAPLAAGRSGFYWLKVPEHFGAATGVSERLARGRLEDTPFYARYLARLRDPAGCYDGVGEYLDLQRFRSRLVQKLLTYKTRRVEP